MAQAVVTTLPPTATPRAVELAPPALRAGCDTRPASGEIIVCGGGRSRYRLPLPDERTEPDDRPPGGMAALTPYQPCGLSAGGRRCGKAEAARYGYGNGRDPVTVLAKLTKKLVDPDD